MAAGTSHGRVIKSDSLDFEDIHLNVNWEDVICPICLDFPHNGVLLLCSSYEKGCRPFMCDTDHAHSNCLDRFKSAYGVTKESIQAIPSSSCVRLNCPLCRGEVTGWIVIDEARVYLNMKRRCCEEKHCSYVGNYMELQKHVNLKHPHSRPSEIDPARRLDWENFQQSSEIIDVLSTIQAEMPHGVVLGDYVIEYGDEDMGDDYEMPRVRGNWWTSCILYKVFNNFRASRNRHRSRGRERRRSHHGSSFNSSSRNESSAASPEFSVHGGATRAHVEFVGRGVYGAASRRSPDHHHSYRRRRSRYRINED